MKWGEMNDELVPVSDQTGCNLCLGAGFAEPKQVLVGLVSYQGLHHHSVVDASSSK